MKRIFSPILVHSRRLYNNHGTMRYYSKEGGGGGFFDLWRQEWKRQVNENEGLKKAQEELSKTTTAKIAEKTLEGTKKVAEATSEKVLNPVGEALENASEAVSGAGKKIIQSKTVQSVVGSVKEQSLVKFMLDELTTERLREHTTPYYSFKSAYGRKLDNKEGFFYNPYSDKYEKVDESTLNTKETGVKLYEKKEKSKNLVEKWGEGLQQVASKFSPNNPLSKVVGGVGSAVNYMGQTVFKSTETAEVIAEFKKRDSKFDLEKFLLDVECIIIPQVLKAYFEDDQEALKRLVSETCWRGHLFPRIQARLFSKVKFDTTILEIRDVDIMHARFVGDEPILIFNCHVQYVYCLKDENGLGKIVEGSKSDIRGENQLWMFQIDPSGETRDYEIAELSFGGSVKIM